MNDPAKRRVRHVQIQVLNRRGGPDHTQAYNTRMNIKVDQEKYRKTFSDAQLQRTKEREEWAKQAEVRHQTRLKLIQEQNRRTREAIRAKSKELLESSAMVERMLQELYELNPEWEARKKQVQRVRRRPAFLVAFYSPGTLSMKRKAEQAKLDQSRHTQIV